MRSKKHCSDPRMGSVYEACTTKSINSSWGPFFQPTLAAWQWPTNHTVSTHHHRRWLWIQDRGGETVETRFSQFSNGSRQPSFNMIVTGIKDHQAHFSTVHARTHSLEAKRPPTLSNVNISCVPNAIQCQYFVGLRSIKPNAVKIGTRAKNR